MAASITRMVIGVTPGAHLTPGERSGREIDGFTDLRIAMRRLNRQFVNSLISMLYRNRRRFDESHRNRGTAGERRCVPASSVYGRRSGASSDGSADDRAFRTAKNAANDGAADRSAANLCRAFAAGRIAFAVNGFGLERNARTVCQDYRCESNAETRALSESPAPFHQCHLAVRFGA